MGTTITIKNSGSILILALFLLLSCSHHPPQNDELVTVETALFQARSSYLLGCTLARVELKASDAFEHCSSKAQKHLQDLKDIMNQFLD